MTAPLVYNIVQQSVIVRTCITQLKQEVFRRGYVWEKAYESKCKSCQKTHKRPVKECARCGSLELDKPDPKQLEYAEKFIGGYVIRMHRIKELFRGDPVTMSIYADEIGIRGTKGFTCINHRNFISQEPHEMCQECNGPLYPIHYINRANGDEQFYLEGEVLHFS